MHTRSSTPPRPLHHFCLPLEGVLLHDQKWKGDDKKCSVLTACTTWAESNCNRKIPLFRHGFGSIPRFLDASTDSARLQGNLIKRCVQMDACTSAQVRSSLRPSVGLFWRSFPSIAANIFAESAIDKRTAPLHIHHHSYIAYLPRYLGTPG